MEPEKEGFFDHVYNSLTTNKQIQDSLKCGIGVATTFSLFSFLRRGLPGKAIATWIYTFIPVTLGTSFYYDYTRIKENLKMQQYEAAMKYNALTRGTDEDLEKDRIREIEDYFPSKPK